jgi:hypothetical protein
MRDQDQLRPLGSTAMTLTQEHLDKLKRLREELLASTEDENNAAIHALCGLGMVETTCGVPRITAQGLHELERYGAKMPSKSH